MIKKTLLIAIAFMAIGMGNAHAEVIVSFSTSGTDAAAGSQLDMTLGEIGSMYIWLSTGTQVSETLAGVALDVDSSNSDILEAVAHIIENPNSRWLDDSIEPGRLGDLTRESQAFSLPGIAGEGMFTDGDFLLYSEVRFQATGLGTTNLSFLKGANGFGDALGASVEPTFANVASVDVVPEPSSALLLALGGVALLIRRRKR